MTYRTLSLELRPPIAYLRIHAGRLDDDELAEIDRAAESISDDQDIHVALLAFEDELELGIGVPNGLPFRSIEMMAQPVIACIERDCDGSALELALACDIRIAAEGTAFALSNNPGTPNLGATQRLPRLIGHPRASSMLLRGEGMDASAALASGLVNEVVPAGETQRRAEEIAATIASRGPIAVRYAKEAIRDGLEMPLEQALRYETDLTIILQTTSDRAEGVAAFVEKRPPKFEGR